MHTFNKFVGINVRGSTYMYLISENHALKIYSLFYNTYVHMIVKVLSGCKLKPRNERMEPIKTNLLLITPPPHTNTQNVEYRTRIAISEWSQLEYELTRERGLWGSDDSSPLDKWRLDTVEGVC